MTSLKTTLYIEAKDNTAPGLGKTRAGLQSISTQLAQARTVLLQFFAAGKIAEYSSKIIELSDQYKLLNGRLSLVTDSSQDLQRVQQALFQQSQDTRGGYADTVSLYTRLTRATQTLNFSEKQRLDVTKAINQSMIVSGATTEEASRAIIQLSQGLAAGTLRGQDLKSVLEQAPRLAQAIADGLHIQFGELRTLAASGKLTSEEIINAILAQKDVFPARAGGELRASIHEWPGKRVPRTRGG